MRLCCWARGTVEPAAPPPALPLDLVADLPTHARDSGIITAFPRSEDIDVKEKSLSFDPEAITSDETRRKSTPSRSAPPTPPRSPSIHVEDYCESSQISPVKSTHESRSASLKSARSRSNDSRNSVESRSSEHRVLDRTSTPGSRRSGEASPASERSRTPGLTTETVDDPVPVRERDVRGALAECNVPPRHEDWEVIETGLGEIERLAIDEAARAPASSWRAVTRGASAHVKSLRSRVARAACRTVGALFEHRGRVLEPELEEAAVALLERCADVNRFLRADAASALCRVACGGSTARAGVALARRGASHRAGPVRAAAAAALVRLVRRDTPARVLSLAPEPRAIILRAAGELLADANAEARMHARQLCLILSEDIRFRNLLKEAMPLSRYRAIEKLIDKLQIR